MANVEPSLIVLLKGSSSNEEAGDEEDMYISLFSAHFPCVRLGVLGFEYLPRAIQDLEEHQNSFDSFLVTSARSVLALEKFASPSLKLKLQSLPWFVVGEGSEEMARSRLGVKTIFGSESGCATRLLKTAPLSQFKSIAYLCGNLRKPTISDGLVAAKIPFHEFILYRTIPDVSAVLPSAPLGSRRVCVFFSPSGVTAVGNQVNHREDLVVAIGETTHRALLDEGLPCHIVSASPNPQSLLVAVQAIVT